MLKNIIAPVQAWLLSQGRCVGCSTMLSMGKKIKKNADEEEITCRKCGRIFLYTLSTKRYRRAPLAKIP